MTNPSSPNRNYSIAIEEKCDSGTTLASSGLISSLRQPMPVLRLFLRRIPKSENSKQQKRVSGHRANDQANDDAKSPFSGRGG